MSDQEKVEIRGHQVAAVRADQFFHGSDGRPTTDEEYDESMRRIREAEARDTGEDL